MILWLLISMMQKKDYKKLLQCCWYASNPYNYKKIYDFAHKFNLRVIEDAAHAFGCEYKNRKIGSIGDIICFSFDNKNIIIGEGGNFD